MYVQITAFRPLLILLFVLSFWQNGSPYFVFFRPCQSVRPYHTGSTTLSCFKTAWMAVWDGVPLESEFHLCSIHYNIKTDRIISIALNLISAEPVSYNGWCRWLWGWVGRKQNLRNNTGARSGASGKCFCPPSASKIRSWSEIKLDFSLILKPAIIR